MPILPPYFIGSFPRMPEKLCDRNCSLFFLNFFLCFLLSLSALSSSVVNDSGRICWKSSPMHGPTWGERKDEEAAMHMLISLEACIGWALWSCRWVVWLDLASPSPQCQGGMGEGG